jgi:hypothetical protein
VLNEFSCLSNALLQAGLRCALPVAFAVPEHVRELVKGADVRDVRAVTLHQCPRPKSQYINYEIEVHMRDGSTKSEEFQATGSEVAHDTFVLYDRQRDGLMKHLHLLH